MIELTENRYGKSRVRLMKVTRHPEGNDVLEWTVQVLLKGDFDSAHLDGDNSKILATDTMKNTVYSVARSSTATTMEAYAVELAAFLLGRNPQVSSVAIRIESALWKRLTIDGQPHPDTFMHGSGERQTTHIQHAQGSQPTIHSGFDNLVLLKTANSAFEGYIKDSLTTLPETTDRVFGTAVRAEWRYATLPTDFDATRTLIRETMLRVFANHFSKSVQQTLYAMAEAALATAPEIYEIELAMPNKHCLLADLSRFGQDNPNQIFVPTDEPHGYIEAKVRRKAWTLPEQAERVIARARRLALCTTVPGEITRLSFTPPMHEVHTLLRGWMEAAGLAVHIDTAGNLRALYPAATPDAPRLLIASHLDTVPNAGAFDGILGVLLGLALVESLDDRPLPSAIEIVGFSDEEGVRFGKPFLGTRALFGPLDPETLARTDRYGVSVAEAMRAFAQAAAATESPRISPNSFAYLEFHIEQGPVLETEDQPLGVVEAIAGQTRLQLIFTGQANHAGTTPMRLRRDALTAAAAWIVETERYAASIPGLVATVGRLEARPGAVNVVPGEVLATLDVRHAYDAIRQAAVEHLVTHAEQAATARGVTLAATRLHDQPAVPMDPHLVALLQQAASSAGFSAQLMTSGAGHDAMIVAPRLPAVMLFLRSPGGLSHHPDETVLSGDVEAALATAMHFLAALAKTT